MRSHAGLAVEVEGARRLIADQQMIAGAQFPEARRYLHACASQNSAIARDGQGMDGTEAPLPRTGVQGGLVLFRSDVPEQHDVICGSRGQYLAVAGEGDGFHTARRPS